MMLTYFVILLGVGCICYGSPTASGTNVDDRNNFFNAELLSKFTESSEGNGVVAPANIKAALLILAEAANGTTRQQILSSLRLPYDMTSLRSLAKTVNTSFKSNGTELEGAARVWVGKNITVAKSYAEILEKYYSGDVANVNFAEAKAAETINKWVEKNTHGYIKTIIDGSLDPTTRVFITSATYFKGIWKFEFDKDSTRERCFNVPNSGCNMVPFMENTANYKYNYIASLNADVVEIPYEGDRVSMLIFLPREEGYEAVRSLARDMVLTPISTVLSSLEEDEVTIQIPKFTIENKLEMIEFLFQLGIKDLFTLSSDLSNGFPGPKLQVDSVIHKAMIEVDEKGTVAAAVSGISIIPLMGSTVPIIRIDRPFSFTIVDKMHNSILFGGKAMKLGKPKETKVPQKDKRASRRFRYPVHWTGE